MEIILSKDASKSISVLQCCHISTNTDGFLIGHKRGNMYFVEKILPSPKGFFPSSKEYYAMRQTLDDKILGFYSFHTTESKIKKILAPFAYGKIFLRLDQDSRNQWVIKPFAIEHDKDFFLVPVALQSTR